MTNSSDLVSSHEGLVMTLATHASSTNDEYNSEDEYGICFMTVGTSEMIIPGGLRRSSDLKLVAVRRRQQEYCDY